MQAPPGALAAQHAAHRPASAWGRLLLAAFAVVGFALFAALGSWQIDRRAWKLALIERTEQRVHAPAVAPPGPERWPQINAAEDEYRHLRVAGVFLHDKETLVQASTELGSGYWVLTPLALADGSLLLVNRGFVPPEKRERATRLQGEAEGPVVLTGLLRISEPKGGFLRDNDPPAGRWYSRDVAAIAAARGLAAASVAPYFVDADAAPDGTGSAAADWPRGGLTVIAFHNNHLVYAITWYALALMVAAAAWHVWRGREPAGDTDNINANANAGAKPRAPGQRDDGTAG